MNNFYVAVQLLLDWFTKDEEVNTITRGYRQVTDLEKKNIFPLLHLNIISASVVSGGTLFTFDLAALDIRNNTKEAATDKFLQTDNELDNYNTCFSILNRFLLWAKSQHLPHDIALESWGQLQPISSEFTNGLDGWGIEVTLNVPNNDYDVCG